MFNKYLTATQEAFRIAVALTLCVIIYQYLKIDRGYWSTLTVLIIYSVPMSGLALRKAKDRLIGTCLGIVGSYLFANLILIHDYQFAYLCFIFMIPAIFYLLIRDYYSVSAFFITVTIVTGITIMTPYHANLDQLMLERLFYTGIGVLVVFFCELCIFPNASKVGAAIDTLTQEMNSIFIKLLKNAETILVTDKVPKVSLSISEEFIKHYRKVHDTYYSQLYELRYRQHTNFKYQKFFETIDALIPLLAAHVGMMQHLDKMQLSEEERIVIAEKNAAMISAIKDYTMFLSQKNLDNTPRVQYETSDYSYNVQTNSILMNADQFLNLLLN